MPELPGIHKDVSGSQDIYSLLGPASEAIMHLNVQKYCLLNRTYYFPKVPENYFWRCIKALGLIFSNFYKDPVVCLRSLNFFKYGREAASLKMLYKSIPTLGKKPIRHYPLPVW